MADGEGSAGWWGAGNSGASDSGCSAAADQEKESGRCRGHCHDVHSAHCHTGLHPLSNTKLCKMLSLLLCKNTIIFIYLFLQQIQKILNLYTPVNEFEERVSASFIKSVQVKCVRAHVHARLCVSGCIRVCNYSICSLQALLKDRQESPQLLMDSKMIFPLSFPFNPSPVALESLQIPQSLNLGFLMKL